MTTSSLPSIEEARKTSDRGPGWDEGESLKTGSERKRKRVEIYVAWLLTPAQEREPKTKAELAELLNVTTQTLRNYEKEPSFQRQMSEEARNAFRVAGLPEVIQHLSSIATGNQGKYGEKASPSAAVSAGKTLLDWLEKTRDIREDNVDLGDLTEGELVQLALRILQGQAAPDDD